LSLSNALDVATAINGSSSTPRSPVLLGPAHYRDIAIPLGRYVRDAKPGLVPCSDAAAEVVEVGEGVDDYRPGDRAVSTFQPR
jgi:NADPH:quinone reductase-like Zn-dependent oxidoreductase